MEPLKIHWQFARPVVVPAHPIHLDALLAWAAVDEAVSQGQSDPLSAADSLPLACWTANSGAWVWQASQLRFRGRHGGFMTQSQRRAELYELAVNQARGVFRTRRHPIKRARPGAGPYKGYVLWTSMAWYMEATAYCTGESDRIQELLARVRFIGKRRRERNGEVAAMEISHSPDPDAWRDRRLPIDPSIDREGYAYSMGPLRPPYWRRCTAVPGLDPVR